MNHKIIPMLFVFLLGIYTIAFAQPVLTIQQAKHIKTYSKNELLAGNVYRLTMSNSRAYLGVEMNYAAVKICHLLKDFNVKDTDTLELVSSDDFYALLPAKYALACDNNSSVGYIAIEEDSKPWPKLTYNNPDANQPDHGSAGPLAVVWTKPENNYISNEYWAWKIVRINILNGVSQNDVIPAPQHVTQEIRNGYHAYVSRCSGCHTMNGLGKGRIGPDLNMPNNATERFANDDTLKKFIRDPQSVRKKANDRMSGTNEQFLSSKDLTDLITYLHYMKKTSV